MNVSKKNSEKFLGLDLLLSNGFKAQNMQCLVCAMQDYLLVWIDVKEMISTL